MRTPKKVTYLFIFSWLANRFLLLSTRSSYWISRGRTHKIAKNQQNAKKIIKNNCQLSKKNLYRRLSILLTRKKRLIAIPWQLWFATKLKIDVIRTPANLICRSCVNLWKPDIMNFLQFFSSRLRWLNKKPRLIFETKIIIMQLKEKLEILIFCWKVPFWWELTTTTKTPDIKQLQLVAAN